MGIDNRLNRYTRYIITSIVEMHFRQSLKLDLIVIRLSTLYEHLESQSNMGFLDSRQGSQVPETDWTEWLSSETGTHQVVKGAPDMDRFMIN